MYTLFQKTVSTLIIAALVFSPVRIYAMPDGGAITDGTGTINPVDTVTQTLTIDQTSAKMSADWNSFSIAAPETVKFNQPDASSIALNRVVGVSPSEIFGKLQANGRIFLVNPNGILFGVGSQVDTAGLVASTLNMTTADFMAGKYTFTGSATKEVLNYGELNAPGGFVALLGTHVENFGAITADLGTVALASGDAITLGLDGQSLISVAIDQPASNSCGCDDALDNWDTGTLSADGGKVLLTAQALPGIFKKAINNEGLIEAGSLESQNGIVELTADHDITSTGTITASRGVHISSSEGNVGLDGATVSVLNTDGSGADVYVQGEEITIEDSTVTAEVGGDADGAAGIYLGTDPAEAKEGDVITKNINILNSTLSATVSNAGSYAHSDVEMDLTGNLNIKDSTLSAISTVSEEGKGYSHIDLNLFGDGEGNVVIDNSGLTSQVEGQGYANIVIYKSNEDGKDTYWSDLMDEYLSGLSNLIDIGSDTEVPINGSIDISNSTLHAQSASNTADILDLFNNDSSVSATVGMMSKGPITVSNSEISAENQTSPAFVGLLSDANVNIDSASTISATTKDTVAVVGIAGLGEDKAGASVNMEGKVTADAGDGVGVVAIGGINDVNVTGDVEAYGDLDTVGFLTGLLNNLLSDYGISLGLELDSTIGSLALIGSLDGDVTLGNVSADLVGVAALGLGEGDASIFSTSDGLISANFLGLLAKNNIGTSSVWLNTDVDVVAGLTWDTGDIFIDEANDIDLGLNIPLSITVNGVTKTYDLGLPLAALDGSINVESNGDITANTVLAPNGNVNLASLSGSIYGGKAWDPVVYADLLSDVVSLVQANVSEEDISSSDFNEIQGIISDLKVYLSDLPTDNVLAENITMTANNGNIVLDGNKITAENEGSASVSMTAQGISITDSDVTASASNGGTAAISMYASNGDINIDPSNILAETDYGYASIRMDAIGHYGDDVGGIVNGNINIADSSVTAVVHNLPAASDSEEVPAEGPYGNASVKLNYNDIYGGHGDVTVDNSDVSALVDDGGEAYVYMGDTNGYTDVDILDGSNVLASIGHNLPYMDTAAVYVNGSNITIDGSTVQALSTDPEQSGNAYVQLQAYDNGTINGGGQITINNSTVKADVAGNGSANVYLYSYGNNYDGTIDVLGGSSILSSVGSGSALTQFYADDINVTGSTLKSTVRDNVDGGYAYLYLFPYNYYYNQNNSIAIDSSVLEASTVGRGTAAIALGSDNWNNNYYYGSGNIDITNGSSLLASVGGGEARIWAWADDILVADSTLKAQSTAGLDSAWSNAYIYLYGYDYNRYNYYASNDTHLTVENSSLTSDVAGLGEAYMYLLSWRYNYYYGYYYGNSTLDILNSTLLSNVGYGEAYIDAQSMGNVNVADSTITSRSQALPVSRASSYSNDAYVQLYSYDYYNNSEGTENTLTVTNSDVAAEVLGDGYARAYLYNYGDYYSSGNSGIVLDNTTVRSSVTGSGSAYIYLQAYDYYDYNNSDIVLNSSLLSSFVGGDGLSEVSLYANYGSILGDATSLITADWVNLYAQNNIGTFESPINTNTGILTANSWGEPVWVPDVIEESGSSDELTVLSDEESGHYVFGTGNIYVNNVGTDLLNVGPDYSNDGEEDYGVVQSNNGVVSITTQGDMVVHNVIAPLGGVLLKSENGSIYAGQSRDGETGANVIAGGASYFSTPNGTIGVGTPDSKPDGISGQISGIVDPGVASTTGVNPSPDLDISHGYPSGAVYFDNKEVVSEEPLLSETLVDISESPVSVGQEIWPVAGSISPMENPLKVDIELVPGTPSVIPESAVPAFGGPVGLMLQIGQTLPNNSPVAQLANPLFKDYRAFYEILNNYRLVSSEPINPTTLYAYHPLSDADTGAFDNIALENGAYEFIDGNLNYNGDVNSYFEDGKKKKN